MKSFSPYIIWFLVGSSGTISGQLMTLEPMEWNSEYNEFAPAVYGEELVYCSDRPSQFGVKWVDAAGHQPVKIYRSSTSTGKKNQFLNSKLNTRYNEGPVCFNKQLDQFFYTGTIINTQDKSKSVLGIFVIRIEGSVWANPISFPFNSKEGSYNVAHPMLSPDGTTLYFTSDMPGTNGGTDIFYSKLETNGWSEPVNMGPDVNSHADECYPFIDDFSNFYFSSNRIAASGMDVYECNYNKDHYLEASPLPEPINGPFDDFSFISTNGGELGYFSSNRNGKDDDIFKFEYTYPTFESCPPAEQPTFCYYFEETSIIPNDSVKFIYEWELGDATLASGLSTEHCYKDFGSYHIALNVYDSLTKVKFARVSELDLVISKSPLPWITAKDSIQPGIETQVSALGTDIADYQTREYYWNFGDGRHSKGYSTSHQFMEPGIYEIELGIIGLNTLTNAEEKRCATKKIIVGSPTIEGDYPADTLLNSSILEDMVFIPDDSTTKLMYAPDSTAYFIEFHEGPEQLSLDDPYFNNIKYEITERFNEEDTLYKYSVGNTTEMHVLMRIYNDLVDKGYTESLVRESKSDEFAYATIKKWWYFVDSLESAINTQLNKFNDIQFNKDDFKIRPESYDNLDYIAQVLIMEPHMKLKIMAHTDSIGSADHNMKLSQQRAQEVVKYFIQKGIKSTRLKGEGYGEGVPLVSNTTEQGRSVNRRVSFEIILEDSTHR